MPQNELNPFDAVIQGEQEQKRALFNVTVGNALSANPDEVAQRNRLSTAVGVPRGVVDVQPDEIKRAAAIKEIADNAAKSPVLERKYTDADFAKLASDDSGVLSSIAAAARWLTSAPGAKSTLGGDIQAAYHSASSGTAGAFGAVTRTAGVPLDWLDDTRMPGGNPLRRLSEGFMAISDNQAAAAKRAAGKSETWLGGAISSGVQSFVQNAPSMALGLLPGGQAAAITGMAAMSGGQSYQKDIADGVPHWKAALHGTSDAVIEAGTEMGPLHGLVDNIKAGSSLFTTMVKNAWAENKGEQVATALQDLNDWAINDVNKGKTFADYLKERPEAAAQTLIATLVGSAGNVTLSHGMQSVADKAAGYDRQAQQAEQHAQALEDIQKTASASKLLARSPEHLTSYMQELADEGVPHVYVDSAKLVEAGVDLTKLAATVPSVAAQMEQVRTGGDIVIPTGELLASTIGSEFAQPLIDHARTDVDGMSRVEAKVYMQEKGDSIKAEVDRVLAEQESNAEFKAGRDAVQAQLLAQLNEVKRFTPAVNQQYATLAANFYSVMAARTGMSVQQFADTYKLGFKSESVAGGMYDQGGQLATESDAFKNWFGDSKVVDAAGKPLVVYHGTVKSFDAFDPNAEPYTYESDRGLQFFLNNPKGASHYAISTQEAYGGNANVMPVYVSLRTPRVETTDLPPSEFWDTEGPSLVRFYPEADGFVIHGDGETMYVTKSPTQIKSVFNRGTFDPNDANILNQDGQAPRLMAVHNLTIDNLLYADQIGGLAVPSVGVITDQAGGVEGFGEITLIGRREMVDPKSERVFSSDAYTVRFPRPEYPKAKSKDAMVLVEKVRAASKEFDDRSLVDTTFDSMVNTPKPDEVVSKWLRSNATKALFLREQGVDVSPVMQPVRLESGLTVEQYGELRPLFEKALAAGVAGSPEEKDLQAKIETALRENYKALGKRDVLVDKLVAHAINQYEYVMGKDARAIEAGPRVDSGKTAEVIDEALKGKEAEFKAWVEGQIMPKFGEPFLKVGSKKLPYILPNIVDAMTDSKVKGKEKTMTYGPGQVRAAASVEFSNLEQMRAAAKESIADPEAYKVAKEQSEKLLSDYREAVAEYTTIKNWRGEPDVWEAMDGSMRALAKWATSKKQDATSMKSALRGEDFNTSAVPAEIIDQAMAAGRALLDAPVPYFEAKPQRAVSLNEFAGAVVPAYAPQQVLDVLAKHGIATKKITADEDRTQAAKAFAAELSAKGEQTLFQEARGQIAFGNDITQQASIISLLKGADLSTFIHESGHFFLEVQTDLANRIAARIAVGEQVSEGERSILDDMNTTLRWMGVAGDQDLSALDQWAMLTAEQKREYHEAFARGFEAYAFEGKAPSMELRKVFQTFRAWLVNVYRNLLKSINASTTDIAGALKVELTDEVRAVMDRMLATTEQIAEAEAYRGMGPLFNTPEQAGMTLDEFKDYHDQGVQATQDATEELQGKGLRDMRWLRNARSRKLKELQKQHNALRKRIELEVKAEVLGQPLYRAWTFLTSKQTDKVVGEKPVGRSTTLNPEVDNLFEAIAKLGGLNRDEVKSQWGIDAKEKLESGVFGAPVVRKADGLSIEAMAGRLAENGYLLPDENGGADLAKFEELFDDQRRGTDRYSIQRDMAAAYGDAPLNLPDLPEVGFGKLRTEELRRRYGTKDDAIWRKLSERRMTSDDGGLDPDVVAELFGFTSGDELVKRLADAEPPKSVIEGRTDQRMLEEHGDLATPAGLERSADAAIHNEARAKFVAAELGALQKAMRVREKVPGQKNTVDVLAKAAREYATEIIARLKVRDVRPAQYAAAEARAAKAAVQAVGDVAKATEHKRNQLINLYATKAAYQAQDDVRKALEYFKKFDKTSPALDADYADQIHALLERFDLRASTSLKALDKRKSLVEWVESQVDQGMDPDIPAALLQEAYRKSFKDMTVEEVRGLYDTVKQIEHLGRLKSKLLTAKENRSFEAAVGAIVAGIEEHSKGRTADTRTSNTNAGSWWDSVRGFGAAHIKVASWARIMDGGQDGGPVWEYLIRTANDAGNREVLAREQATRELTKLVAPVLKEGKISDKGQFFPSIGRSLNKEARLAIALNVGNEGNLQRLLGGEGWTLDQIRPVLDTLSETDWQFVQGVWDYFETYRPQIAAKERRVYGKEPNWVEAHPVQTKWGVLRGGYYPVKYDPKASGKAESHADAEVAKQQLKGAYTSATTRRSFTKARAEEVHGRPLLYSLDGIYNGVQEVIHDLSVHEWLIDTNRLLRSKAVDQAIRSTYGPDVVRQFKTWAEDIATGDRGAQNAGEKAAAWVRQGVSVSGLGLNIMSALMQPLGITQSMVRIGAKWAGLGVAKYIAGPADLTDAIHEKSEFMRTRALTRLREIAEVRSQVKGQTKVREAIDSSAYFLMMHCQQMVDVPTWWGAYEKAIADGNGEDRAVALSDQAVIDAQGSGGTKDLANIERGGALTKLFTTFYSFFNTALNLGVTQTMTAESKAKLAADYLLLYSVPVILGAMLKDALTAGDSGDWDDPEHIIKKLIGEHLSFLAGLMVGMREMTGAFQALTGTAQYTTDYSGPAGLRFLSDSVKLAKQINQGEMDVGLRKAIINTAGELLRLPSAQINRTITGIEALRDGKTSNPGVVLTGYQEPH